MTHSDFTTLGLSDALTHAAQKAGMMKPTAIQQHAIPPLLAGRDVLLPGQTGTGKTAAFVLPALQKLARLKEDGSTPSIPRILILEPTRDLAMQTAAVCRQLGRQLPLKTRVICGGVPREQQALSLAQGADIIVATHGRLLDFVEKGDLSLEHILYLVLDEADRLLDEEFSASMTALVPYIADRPQTVFCSATLPAPVMALAKRVTKDPIRVEPGEEEVTPRRIRQQALFITDDQKEPLLQKLLETTPHLKDGKTGRTIIFTKTKQRADSVAKSLRKARYKAIALHGGQTQGERKKTLERYQEQAGAILVTTDIAARGLDIDDIQLVINMDLPQTPELYIHRIGRTARAGKQGRAVTFVTFDERARLRDIEKHINYRIRIITTETL
ncbi:DEAD/DEAH box helicase [Bombella sp. ESL0385]|uniref:DEAD/DEAH box helicase n=1 Tax=Bombella sp. ESL0385 TaxID=2676446 RepID=UPI0012D8D4FD|nr:DEAD/DEAH box helicase [Bombella sp. ESL0385]MUG90106.1 DEAD/DEAH box helicase [Bombella sp. ESL0385]